MAENNNNKKLTLIALILMIFTSVFGFANMPRAFYLMGYAAIPWYLLSAILFFIPYAFMMAEYGAAYQNESGGIYSWMEKSVGAKYAFITTFMWYASYIVWMVNVSSSIWVPLSNAIFGYDRTSEFALFGLNATKSLGILAVIWIIVVTYISTKGVEQIRKITSIGGSAIALLNIVLLIGGLTVLLLNKGRLAQPIENVVRSFTFSPNPAYQSLISIFSFLTYAIFAYGGLEALGGLVDQTENAEKTFPKGVTIAAIVIAVGYSLGILACGLFTNWNNVLSVEGVNMANVAYILMQNLGYELGIALGISANTSLTIGLWIARFTGLSMFLALSGAFFTLTYSPLKTLIQGSPQEVWPGNFAKLDEGMPKNAMKVQATIVIALIVLVSFGGKGAAEFFSLLIAMTNVAMTIPYVFLAAAFPAFKRKQLKGEVDKPFLVYKTYTTALVATVIVSIVVTFANIFSIIEPTFSGKTLDTIMMIAGPVIFAVIAFVLYTNYEKKHIKSK
ncbi:MULTISPECIES: glutamate/gamma-aminobutyrate family transporter YjeM [unclassified Romboutsia]|uniref:glutamate/gamma-aminobutyrate family transporter YjeM n=1 Tax=unclassified Romboutsia TaxID=2626894 RepID=UPI000822B276|nr:MULTISPECIES: glutamate/gamma-aminobutyrate family transporter YjeM [unclassified Romboutsia]SCH04718.1 Inner membrane transporter yjeM [uncultured Clostridium sp.]